MIEKLNKIKTLVSPLSAFFLGTMLACCAYSLLTSILAVRLTDNGVSASTSGIVLALYYLGFMVAAKTAYKVINNVGQIRAFSTYISVFSIFVLMHYFSSNYVFWGVLRLLEGYCMGAATMCLESWLNSRATNKNRGSIMALYMIMTYAGSSIAQLMINIPDPNGVTIYILVAVLFSIAVVPISLTALPTPDIAVHKSMSLSKLFMKTPVGVAGCISSGLMVGSFYVLSPVYLKSINLDLKEISLYMFFGILGGLLAQFPMGRLSDRSDRRYVMMTCCVVIAIISPLFLYAVKTNIFFLAGSAFLLGVFTFVIYPICVSHVNDLVDDSERVNASGMLIMLQSSGLILGPIIASLLMSLFGSGFFYISYAVFAGAFVIFTLRYIHIRPKIDYVNITKTDPVPMAATQAYTEVTTHDSFMERMIKSRWRHKGKRQSLKE